MQQILNFMIFISPHLTLSLWRGLKNINLLLSPVLHSQVGWAKEPYPVPIKDKTHKDGHVVPPLPTLRFLLLTQRDTGLNSSR